MLEPNYLWGIDLGGTKIEGIVAPAESPLQPIARLRRPTEAEAGYEHIVSQIVGLVRDIEGHSGLRSQRLGMSTPGCAEPTTGLMKNCNTTALNGRPLAADVSRALDGIEVKTSNDANCFALAEAGYGSGRGAHVVFGVIVGTGVGGGIVVNGEVLYGAHGIAGEWGHNILEPGGELCYCGKRGCVETVFSGPALEKFYERRTGTRRPLAEIATRAREDDSAARATIEKLCHSLSNALAVIINIIDPDVIVLGGGVSNIPEIYEHWPAHAQPLVFNNAVRTKLKKHKLGDSAGVFGAALLWG